MIFRLVLIALAGTLAVAAPSNVRRGEAFTISNTNKVSAKLGGQNVNFTASTLPNTEITLVDDPNKYGSSELIVNQYDFSIKNSSCAKDTGKKYDLPTDILDEHPSLDEGELYTDVLEISGQKIKDLPVYVSPEAESTIDLSPTSTLLKKLGGPQIKFDLKDDKTYTVLSGDFGKPGVFHKFSDDGFTIEGVTLKYNGNTTKPFKAALSLSEPDSSLSEEIHKSLSLSKSPEADPHVKYYADGDSKGQVTLTVGDQELLLPSSVIINYDDKGDEDDFLPDGTYGTFTSSIGITNGYPAFLGAHIFESLNVVYDIEKRGVWLESKEGSEGK